jgi:hypothetical protein
MRKSRPTACAARVRVCSVTEIARIEKAIHRRAACLHAPRHLYFADFALLHRLLNLASECLFQCACASLFEDAFVFQKSSSDEPICLLLFYFVLLIQYVPEMVHWLE